MLKLLSDLSAFFKATGCDSSTQVKQISLAHVRNNTDALDYLRNNIGDLESCISNNLGQQNALCNSLVTRFSGLLETAAGGSSNMVEFA